MELCKSNHPLTILDKKVEEQALSYSFTSSLPMSKASPPIVNYLNMN